MKPYTSFEKLFSLLKEYKDEHGHCNIPRDYKVGTIHLGKLVNNIRTGHRKTSPEQKAMLDSIGFVWKVIEHTSFEEVFSLLSEYKKEHGHCDVPVNEKIGTINLGVIVQTIRTGRRKTSPEQKAMLDSIAFVWNMQQRTSFEYVFRLLVEYKEEHGHCDVPQNEKVGTINLGSIVSSIRSGNRNTTDDQKAMLDSIGFVWKSTNNQ